MSVRLPAAPGDAPDPEVHAEESRTAQGRPRHVPRAARRGGASFSASLSWRQFATLALTACLLLTACTEIERGKPAEDAQTFGERILATYRGGDVTRAEVEPEVQALHAGKQDLDRDALLAAYAEVAADRAIEEVLLRELEKQGTPDEAESADRDRTRRQLLLDHWLAQRAKERDPSVADDDIANFWEAHRDGLRSRPQRFLSYVFRRTEGAEGADTHAASSVLQRARERILAGESFAEIASEVSESETRSVGGRLGWIESGRLDPSVEAAVFALGIGQISDPVPVLGGLAIFYVQAVRTGQEPTLDASRPSIRQYLAARARTAWLEELATGLEPSPDDLVLDLATLSQRVEARSDEPVLKINGEVSTAAELASAVEGVVEAEGDELPAFRRSPLEILGEIYREQVALRLLALKAEAAAADLGVELRASIDAEAGRMARARAVQRLLRSRLAARIDGASLARFYQENLFLYASPAALRFQILRVPATADPARQLARLVDLADQARLGSVDLAGIAARLAGRVEDPVWIPFDQMDRLPFKIKHYAQSVRGSGLTVPFRHGAELMLIRVIERREPQTLPRADVEDRLRDDYLARHEQALYRRFADEILAEIGFKARPDAILDLLDSGVVPVSG